jgi:hypothetical protein
LVGLACGQGTEDGGSFATATESPDEDDDSSSGDEGDTGTDTGEPKLDVGAPDGEDLPPDCEDLDELEPSSLGCRFYAFDTYLYGDASWRPFGVSVGNPWPVPAVVTIEDNRGPGLREIVTLEVEPYASELIKINGDRGILDLEDHGIFEPGLNIAGAFRITTDIPTTVMQMNPIGGGASAVSDASLLLPLVALDSSYIALGYESAAGSMPGWVDIIATEDGTTVTSPQGVEVLDEFDILHLSYPKTDNTSGDVTGVRVDADKPVAVFSGSRCAFVPEDQTGFCDHLEEQLFPLATWGTQYVGGRPPPRLPELHPDDPERVVWRVVAAVDGAQITLQPPVAGQNGVINLTAAGDFFEFSTIENFVATSDDEPFMLTQYMTGCMDVHVGNGVCFEAYEASGDPYMIQMVPVDQWLDKVPFMTDTSYPRDFAVFTREVGTEIVLDCLGPIPDDHFVLIPGTDFEVGHVNLDWRDRSDPHIDPDPDGEGDCVDGQQYAASDAPVGLFVGGVDFAASYGYPAGMGLKPTWTPPEG